MHQDMLDIVFLSHKKSTFSGTSTAPAPMAPEKQTPSQESCPVDHRAREAWLAQARATDGNAQVERHVREAHTPQALRQSSPASSNWSWHIPFFSKPSKPTASPPTSTPPPSALGTSRVVSSIPRSSSPGPTSCPVNHEAETGADAKSGNWIYPSEKMFFDAMKRKGHDEARVADMKTVVPIHNAVNERAWAEIKAWEAPYTGTGEGKCGGPRLHSFAGISDKMSPKARLNTILGYAAPFDRHDWVVDRCGTRVEYVIDFYAGRPDPSGTGQVSFFLDVRPKLNNWEGVKMRALRGLGLV